MADLIDRHALIKEISKYHITSGITAQATWNECVDIIIEELESFPSAQPEILACGSGELVQESDGLVQDLVKDCISRKQAIDVLSQMQGIIVAEDGIRKGISLAWQQIKDLPSAQPERKMGRWTVKRLYIQCSECGDCFPLIPQNYCPNCGARMVKEGDEHD